MVHFSHGILLRKKMVFQEISGGFQMWAPQGSFMIPDMRGQCKMYAVCLTAKQVPKIDAATLQGRGTVAIAVKSGPLLATAFHPELTDDLRW